MPGLAQKNNTKSSAEKALPVYFGPRRFDPGAHGGVAKLGNDFLFFGVILPLLAMLYETNSHYCAQHFFDPFPTTGHILLFALIPLSNLFAWLGSRRDVSNHYAAMALLNGMAMGVGCLYALMLLPLAPSACWATLWFGFGLLGLAPLLSLPCSWLAGKTVCRLATRKVTYFNAHQVEHIGHMIILVMVLAVELPSTMTRINLSRATGLDQRQQQAGIEWLRKYGSIEVLQRACYERSGRATDILGSIYENAHPIDVDDARQAFYQVTGKPFNSVPIPHSARATIKHTAIIKDETSFNKGVDDEFDIDTDVAGEVVSGIARGLSLSQSLISGKIEPDVALATLDWTLSFDNSSKVDREARAVILLPPHAVVTRATLIIDKVEHDAMIMVRKEARAQYQQSAAARKDPLLVSMCGTDQLLVQCYPVRPGQTVGVRLQLAAPMDIRADEQAALQMPSFVEKNFEMKVATRTDLVTGRDTTLTWSDAEPVDANDAVALDAASKNPTRTVVMQRDKSIQTVWAIADRCSANTEVDRALRPPHYDHAKHLFVLIDTSVSMKPFMAQIADGLRSLPPSVIAEVKMIGDETVDLNHGQKTGNSADYLSEIKALAKWPTEGGQNDFSALHKYLKTIPADDDTAVLWLHGAQPVGLKYSESMQELLSVVNAKHCLYDMQLASGPNDLFHDLYAPDRLVRVPRSGSVASDLSAFLVACRADDSEATQPKEYSFHPRTADAQSGKKVDERLVKIWANYHAAGSLENLEINSEHVTDVLQIVSPISSAVVVDARPDSVIAAEREADLRKRQIAQSNGLPPLASMDPDTFMKQAEQTAQQSKDLCMDKVESVGREMTAPYRDAALFNGPPEPEPAYKAKGAVLAMPPASYSKLPVVPARTLAAGTAPVASNGPIAVGASNASPVPAQGSTCAPLDCNSSLGGDSPSPSSPPLSLQGATNGIISAPDGFNSLGGGATADGSGSQSYQTGMESLRPGTQSSFNGIETPADQGVNTAGTVRPNTVDWSQLYLSFIGLLPAMYLFHWAMSRLEAILPRRNKLQPKANR